MSEDPKDSVKRKIERQEKRAGQLITTIHTYCPMSQDMNIIKIFINSKV